MKTGTTRVMERERGGKNDTRRMLRSRNVVMLAVARREATTMTRTTHRREDLTTTALTTPPVEHHTMTSTVDIRGTTDIGKETQQNIPDVTSTELITTLITIGVTPHQGQGPDLQLLTRTDDIVTERDTGLRLLDTPTLSQREKDIENQRAVVITQSTIITEVGVAPTWTASDTERGREATKMME